MSLYRSAWGTAVMLAGVVGVWAAVETWKPGGVLTVFVFVTAVMASIGLLMTDEGERPEWGRALWLGVASGLGVVAAAGLIAWLEGSGLVLVTVLIAGAPKVLTRARRWYRLNQEGNGKTTDPRWSWSALSAPDREQPQDRAPVPAATPLPASLPSAPWLHEPTTLMHDAELCLAWRASYVALQRPLPEPLRLRVVQRRQELLDELERRDAHGFSAWIASGPRAAGDPSKYIGSAHDHKHGHDQRKSQQ